MKLSVVYKTSKKADTYLYVEKRDDFSRVPAMLMEQFGRPEFVMILNLTKRTSVAQIPTTEFIKKIQKDGFYLQLPPKEKSLLEQHRETMGLDKHVQSKA